MVIGPRAIGTFLPHRLVRTARGASRPSTRSRARGGRAPETVTFTDVWKAEPVSQFSMDKACTSFSDADDDDDVVIDDIDPPRSRSRMPVH